MTLKMNVIDGLFLPLRGKINLKTDEPDGIELGEKGMRKLLLLLVAFSFIALLSSCSDDFWDGYEAGSDGYTYIGTYTSIKACKTACDDYGYNFYRFNSELNNCYCK